MMPISATKFATRSAGTAVLLAGLLLVTACSTTPREIRQAPADNPVLAEVQAAPDRYTGERVRWGGTIIAIDNEPTQTAIEIVARPLHRNGRPADTDRSLGRFIADLPGFLDPAIYAEGRDITVYGVIAGVEDGTIGDHEYRWPVVRVHDHLLWPTRAHPRRDHRAFYYHDPWYPYYYGPRRIVVVPQPAPSRPSPLSR